VGLRGKHTKIWVGGYALTTKTREVSPISIAYDELESSAYTQDHSTLKGQADSTIGLNGYFSKATGEFHDGVKTITDSAVLVSTVFGENAAPAVGDIALNLQAQRINYQVNPNLSDIIIASGDFRARGTPAEFGLLLADLAVTANGQQASVNNGAASANGGVGVLHITGLSAGDTITVLIEDSANNSDWATLITFTLDGSAIGAERLAVTGDVDQYVRASYTVTGSSVSFPIAVLFIRK
jgi:hypothetical protein